ncbi:MAG: chromosomal replication initiator protein DnaA [Alphaproteobacteria bacterium]|nr:chromosomal replication initiator protein DnaA [Alphaproteobacteria bacterium]
MTDASTFQTEWLALCQQLADQLKDTSVMRWLGRIVPELSPNNDLNLWAPSSCICELVQKRYEETIRSLWSAKRPDAKVYVQVRRPEMAISRVVPVSAPISIQPLKMVEKKQTPIRSSSTEEDLYSVFLDKTHTFQSFVVGDSNRFAYEAAKKIAEEETVSFNPLYFHAGVGLGKTHLMHAIAWRIKELYPEKTVLYLSSEQFFQRFIKGLQSKEMDSFKELFRNVDVLLIDDIQFIVGKRQTQEEFFHTFNNLISRGKKIILSADSAPMELRGIEERLRTRLAQGLVVDIHPASYELRLSILHEKMQAMHTELDESVLEFLAKSITSNVRELEGALKRLVAHMELLGGTITPDSARVLLKDILHMTERQVKAPDIIQAVADFYRLTLKDLRSTRRDRAIVRPRQLAMYLTKQLTPMALPDIAKFFERDHTTVIHAVKTIEEYLKRDKQLVREKDLLVEQLKEVR